MPGSAELPQTRPAPPRWAQSAVVAMAALMVWHSLGDHGLFPPDEGRYAAVSGWMAEHGNWFAPEIRGQLHITKPPLAYWAQAASMLAFGKTEFAARFPSAVASTLLACSVFAFARATLGPLVATLATGLLACMPLFLVVGRLAITDPMLALWWWLALCAAWMALRDGRSRPAWVAGFWAACALAGLTKGPLLLAPPAIVCAWLVLAGRWREVARLHPWIGLPLAAAPLAAVAWGYHAANPERALAIWRFEFVDRFTGGKHDTPAWAIPAAFVAGLFPATAMLTLPWFNLSWRAALGSFRAGGLPALLLVATVLPLVGFAILRGSSPTYLLPLAAPLAMSVAVPLARWMDGSVDDLPAGRWPPDVRITLAFVLGVLSLSLPVAAAVVILRGQAPGWAPGWTLAGYAFLPLPCAAALGLCVVAWRRRALRLPALGLAWAAWLGAWLGMHHAEDRAMAHMTMRPLVAAVPPGAPVAMVGFNDLGVDWLLGRWASGFWGGKPFREWIAANPGGIVLVEQAEFDAWERRRSSKGSELSLLEAGPAFDAWPRRRIHVCKVIPPR